MKIIIIYKVEAMEVLGLNTGCNREKFKIYKCIPLKNLPQKCEPHDLWVPKLQISQSKLKKNCLLGEQYRFM